MPKQPTTFYSNQTEDLLQQLLLNLPQDRGFFTNQAFGKVHILVPNSGMQRYLELWIARMYGVCSHIEIGYPGKFLWQLYQQLLPDWVAPDSLDTRQLTFELLAGWQNDETEWDECLAELLAQHQQPRQRYVLASQVARLFKQYLTERPEMVSQWQQGGQGDVAGHRHANWQFQLFQQLNLGQYSRAAMATAFHAAIHRQTEQSVNLPDTVHVFGFHTLPPAQLDDLLAVSQVMQVNFYSLNPSIEYWQDIVPEAMKYHSELTAEAEAELLTIGHPLLASWGQAGKYFIERLNEFETQVVSDSEPESLCEASDLSYKAPLLQAVQHSIQHLTESDNALFTNALQHEVELKKLPSISLHVASSPRREVEVLYDNLLDLLASDDSLAPSDILVILPQLRDYASHIQAIFGTAYQNGQLTLPFSLANQTAAEADEDTQAFLSLLAVIDSDFQAQTLFEALSEQSIRMRFGLALTDLHVIRQWLLDNHFSTQFTDDSEGKFSSLDKLLDQLLLAYTAGDGTALGNRQSADFYQATQQQSLSLLCEVLQAFQPFAHLAKRQQTLADWFGDWQRLAVAFLPMPFGQSSVTEQLNAWFDTVSAVEPDTLFAYETVVADICTLFESEELRGPFLSGGVSFCAVMPMRAIPAKVICLLGMGANFPVIERHNALDLRTVKPKWSDSQPNKESRYCFLETVLSTREKLYLSYAGLDDKTGEQRPPSVLVSELLGFLNRQLPQGQSVEQHIKTTYPLQGFMANQATSYQTIYQTPEPSDDGSATLMTDELVVPLPTVWQATGLAAALETPLLFYLQQHHARPIDAVAIPLREHLLIALDDGLAAWQYKQTVFEAAVLNTDSRSALQHKNLYPPAPIEQQLSQQANDETADLVSAVMQLKQQENQSFSAFINHEQHGTTYRLLFRGDYVGSQGLVNYATGKFSARRQLRAWVNHVLFNLVDAKAHGIALRESQLLTIDSGQLVCTKYQAFEDQTAARQALSDILDFIQFINQQAYPFTYQKKSYASTAFLYKPEAYPLYTGLVMADMSVDEFNERFSPIAEAMEAMVVSV